MIGRILAVSAFAAPFACGIDTTLPPPPPDPPKPTLPLSAQPTKRSDINTAADPTSNTFVLFGGDDGPIVAQGPRPQYRGDTWLFEKDQGWTELSPTQAPSPRGRYATAYDSDNRRLLLFGGRWRPTGQTGTYTLYNDLWAFDYTSQDWTLVDGTGTGPSPRYFSAAAYDASGDRLVLYGGGTNGDPFSLQPTDEVWLYDGSTWSLATTTGTPPSTRLFVSYLHDRARNWLVVFAGQVGDFISPAFNSLYALDLDDLRWHLLHSGAGLDAPPGRFLAMMTHDPVNDLYLAMGGHADPGVLNDVWAFDPDGGNWDLVTQGDTFNVTGLGCASNPSEIPSHYVKQDLAAPERRQGGVLIWLDDSAWLFGGESDCSDHLDDTWELDTAGRWTEWMETNSGETCLRRADSCACLCL